MSRRNTCDGCGKAIADEQGALCDSCVWREVNERNDDNNREWWT